MSKLDSFIRRMQAQRDCLNHAARLVADLPGAALEIGLGNGRTYDHLREILPNREIFVFDRRMAAYASCTPPADHLFLGEVTDMLPLAAARLGRKAVLVHLDIGTSDDEANARLMAAVGSLLKPLVAPGGVVVSNFTLSVDGWPAIEAPPGVKPGRYFLYRAG